MIAQHGGCNTAHNATHVIHVCEYLGVANPVTGRHIASIAHGVQCVRSHVPPVCQQLATKWLAVGPQFVIHWWGE